MSSVYRSCLYRMVNSGLCSNPILLGLLVGGLVHLFNVSQVPVLPDELVDDAVQEPSFLDRLETNINILKDMEKEDTYVRPRFIRDEINMSRNLFIGVHMLEGASLDYMKFFNMTTRQFAENAVVFADSNSEFKPEPNTVILKYFSVKKMLDHIVLKHSDYQYYYILNSNVLLNGLQVSKLLETLLPYENNIFGVERDEGQGCDPEKGLLLSNSMLKHLSTQSDLNQIEGCDLVAENDAFFASSSSDLENSRNSPTLVYNIRSTSLLRDVTRFILQSQVHEMQVELDMLNEEIEIFINESEYMDADWPVHVYTPQIELNRFDRDFADHFNNGTLESTNSYETEEQLTPAETELWNKMADQCVSNPETRLVSGWRKVEPELGVHYLFNIEYMGDEGKLARTDCSILQEFSEPLMVSLPFVTESTKISLVIMITESDTKEVLLFLKNFAKTCLEKNDRVFLMLVFFYTKERPEKNNNKDFYKDIKQSALQLSKKFKKKDKGSAILWYSMQLKDRYPTPVETMDLLTQKLDSKSIILLGSVNMELHSDYLNRVRMNTIEGRIAFSPIPFTLFHPQLNDGPKMAFSSSISFNTSLGHFDKYDTQHLSFYKSDYVNVRAHLDMPLVGKEDDLFSRDQVKDIPELSYSLHKLFQTYGHRANRFTEEEIEEKKGRLHLLRAPEPSLRLRYKTVSCNTEYPRQVLKNCNKRRQLSLGSRVQLANLFLHNHNL